MIKTLPYVTSGVVMGVHDRGWYQDWWRKRLEHDEKSAFRAPLDGRATDDGAGLGGEYLERRGVRATLSRWHASYRRFMDTPWGVILALLGWVYVIARVLRWWTS